MDSIYKTVGINKLANYQYNKRTDSYQKDVSDLITQADAMRVGYRSCGLEKMYCPKSMGETNLKTFL